jgi:hypothetical protein
MKYNVIVVVPVNCKFVEIEAENHAGAIEQATKILHSRRIDHRMFDNLFIDTDREPHVVGPGDLVYTEWDSSTDTCYLVDEVGDEEFANSRWYGPDGVSRDLSWETVQKMAKFVKAIAQEEECEAKLTVDALWAADTLNHLIEYARMLDKEL